MLITAVQLSVQSRRLFHVGARSAGEPGLTAPLETFRMRCRFPALFLGSVLLIVAIAHARAQESVNALLWRDPGKVGSRNLYYGPGGKQHQPHGTVRFIDEDYQGTSPKFRVRDEDDTKWTVKMGVEAKPETAAAHLLWAVGYFTDEDYFLPSLTIEGMPTHLKRGRNLLRPDGTVENVRLKRHLKREKKIGIWHWKHNPFTGQQKFNGLRVMMAVMNNWDVKDENNAIYASDSDSSEEIYLVSDLGASFGATGYGWNQAKSKGNLNSYRHSKFISKVTPQFVDFGCPSRPALIRFFDIPLLIHRLRLRWIGKHIPRADAKWMGSLLARLSPDQIRHAFRSAGYSPQEVEGFSKIVEKRIAELNQL